MSGTLSQYRPGHKPLFDADGEPVYKVPSGPMDWHAIKRTITPAGIYKNGRCVSWNMTLELRQRHVLTPLVEPHRPSKHARGRIRPRTRAEQTRARNLTARFVQISKTMTVDHNRMRAIHDEVAA